MTAGPVNRALLESFYQNPGDVYDDSKTESAFDVVADQVDDNWNYLVSLISGTTPNPQFMQRQAAMNGNFDVAQRGTVFTNPISGSYTLDRYLLSFNVDGGTLPTTLSHEQLPLSSEIFGSYYAYRLTTNGSGASFGTNSTYGVFHRIEHGARYLCGSGQQITLSFYARSNIANKKLGVSFSQRYGTGGSPSAAESITGTIFSLTTTFQRYTITINTNTLSGKTFGTNRDDFFQIGFFHQWGLTQATSLFGGGSAESFVGAGVVDIAQIQVNAGGTPLTFYPKNFSEELRMCQRYYEKSYPYSITPATVTISGALLFVTEDATNAGAALGYVPYRVPKRTATPTVTVYGTSGTINTVNDVTADRALGAGSFALANSEWGFQQDYTLTGATSRRRRFHFVADAEL